MSLARSKRPSADAQPLTAFVALATAMLDPSTPEPARRRLESELLALLPALRALGVFELLQVRPPALRALIEDELAALQPVAANDH